MNVRKYIIGGTLLCGALVLNACSSVQSEDAPTENAPTPVAETSPNPTNTVPNDAAAYDAAATDDNNPEIALAVAAGAVIVNPDAKPNTNPTATIAAKSNVTPPDSTLEANTIAAAPMDPNAQTQAATPPVPASTGLTYTPPSETTPVLPPPPAPVAQDVPAAPQEGYRYTVKNGDTLMKISFEQYGDLYRWREIYASNRPAINDPNHVPPGTILTLAGTGRTPSSVHEGEQYLIQSGDTLSKISNQVYGTFEKWKKIWANNKDLIHDPNKIYAGFSLYYLPEAKMTQNEESSSESGVSGT